MCPYQRHWSPESWNWEHNVQKSRSHPHLSEACLCYYTACFSLIDEHRRIKWNYIWTFLYIQTRKKWLRLELQPPLCSASPQGVSDTSWPQGDTFFFSYWCRNIFISLSGEAGQAGSTERGAEGKRGHVEPDRDTGVTLWHVQIPSSELCLAQQNGTRKWAADVSPDCLATRTNARTCTLQPKG